MSGVRPFVEQDVPRVAALRQRSFRASAHATAAASEAYFRRIFFEGPFGDPGMPGLVYEDEAGRIVGFLGRLARRMILGGEPLRMAVTTQLCVAPDSPRTIAIQLLRHVLGGPHDLLWTDAATDRVRMLWSRLGGHVARIQSLHWTMDLRPSRAALAGVRGGMTTRALRLASRLLMRDADRIAFRHALDTSSRLRANEADDAVMAGARRHLADTRLVSDQGADAEAWVAHRAQEKFADATLRRLVVRTAEGATVGAYSYFARRGANADVVEFHARPGEQHAVLSHLACDAGRQGAVRVAGRLEPGIIDSLADASLRVTAGPPWALFHSPRADIRDAVHSGRTQLSRLEGEWWLNF